MCCQQLYFPMNSNATLPTTVGGRGKYLKNASPKLTLLKNGVEGRYIGANENILPGEIIVVEKAYIATLTEEVYHQQCFQCFSILRAPVPCSHCALVSFCSEKCRDAAWATHHVYECGILGILRLAGVSITCLMALRTLTQAGLAEVLKWSALLSSDNDNDIDVSEEGSSCRQRKGKAGMRSWRDDEFHFPDNFRPDHISSLLKLLTHSSSRTSDDDFQRIVVALFLLSLLHRTTFFHPRNLSEVKTMERKERMKCGRDVEDANEVYSCDEKEEKGVVFCDDDKSGSMGRHTDEERMILLGSLLLRILQTLQFNAHEIAGWDSDVAKSSFLGGGLFPTLAFFNHSCNPSIVRYFMNDTVVVRTVRTIQRGEPVTENYGPIFTQSPREERQATLRSRYWFTCSCLPCSHDWPLFSHLSRSHLSFRCRHCRAYLCETSTESFNVLLRCARCLQPTNMLQSLKALERTEEKFKQATHFLQQGRLDTAVGILVENISLFDDILLPPFPDYHLCQEALRKCYLPLGNQSKTSRVMAKTSEELGHE